VTLPIKASVKETVVHIRLRREYSAVQRT